MIRFASIVTSIALLMACAWAQQPMAPGSAVHMSGVKAQKKLEAPLQGFFTPINDKLKLRATEVEIEPNGSIGEHLHFGPGIRHLLSGELTLIFKESGKEQQVKAGEYFYESGDRNIPAQSRGSQPAKLVIVELVPADLEGGAMVPLSRRPELEQQGAKLKQQICQPSP